jgi:hypothetical protein
MGFLWENVMENMMVFYGEHVFFFEMEKMWCITTLVSWGFNGHMEILS